LHKSNENLVAISMAIKAVNANYKEGENGWYRNKIFGNVLVPKILKRNNCCVLEKQFFQANNCRLIKAANFMLIPIFTFAFYTTE
jgi:hypothetical protein